MVGACVSGGLRGHRRNQENGKSGCRGQSDGVAEGFKLADAAAFTGGRAGAAAEVIGAEVLESCLRILQEVPDYDENGTSDRDQCAFPASPAGDPSVAFTKESARPSCTDGGFAEDPGRDSGCVPGRAVALSFSS